MKRKFSFVRLLAVLLCAGLLSSCSFNFAQQKDGNTQTTPGTESDENSSGSSNVSLVTMDMITYESDDYYYEWKDQNPSYIELNGNSASIKGFGAEVKDGVITITSAGVYAISGKLDDGQIIVDVKNKGIVRLVLNGMEIKCDDNVPIYIKNAEKTIISLQDGTQNSITDGEKYVLSDADSDEPNAAIFSKDNLTINGPGTLNVNGNYNNGIVSKDELRITGGNININSADDGLIGRDMVLVKEGNITIKSGGDSIKSTNDEDNTKGFLAFEGGVLNIKAGADGLQAETSVIITDGDFTIATGGGSINGSDKAGNEQKDSWGRTQADTSSQQSSETESQSAKGVKASSEISVSGGTFSFDSADDAFHSNNSISVIGGDINIASGDDGIHADSSITIKDGKINITKSYEGIESTVVSISGGDIDVVSKDDGINISGGNDGSSINGRPGQNAFAASPNSKLNIDGGYIAVNADGDGLDSNGSIYMNGGRVVVNGPTNNGNGALDYNGSFEISGGLLFAAGSSGMAQAPSDQSTQSSIIMNFNGTQQAGTLFSLNDSSGNTVAAFAPEKQYQSVVISSPDLKNGTAYTLSSGGTVNGNSSDGLYTDGSCQGGIKITDFTISKVTTWLSESGETEEKSPNMGGRPGGNPGAGMNPGAGGNKGAGGNYGGKDLKKQTQ